ncbi:hypothetical protein [Streptomyces liangshanensis]|uniref:hypothetical protein n=1 Tax=Streptomyces liangshanensis TaxID=2717324 RepID=UPI0036DD7879
MPLDPARIRVDLACGPGPDGSWHGWFDVRVPAADLWPLGLHPNQPASVVTGPSPPGWWHAAVERDARRSR